MSAKILITGSTGRVGRIVVNELIDHHGILPRLLVRDQSKARQIFGDKVEYSDGDLADPDSLLEAMQGVTAAMLLSPVHPLMPEYQGNLVKAAVTCGDVYIVKMSGLGTSLDSFVDSGRWHAEIEQEIIMSGLPYTFLRPLFFMQNLAFQIPMAAKDGIIRSAVTEHSINMIDAIDIASVICTLLVDPDKLPGRAVALTGAATYNYTGIADLLGNVLGRNVKFQSQEYADLERTLKASGQPDWHIQILMQFNRAFNEGQGEVHSTLVHELLQRQPISLEKYLERAIAESGSLTDSNPFPS
jgi:uncharacterized protein YbjT (DUF2867 family)